MESDITREELIELIGVTTANINSQFELWLTVTFAVIIASYLAGHRLTKGLQYLIAVLYTTVSVLLLLMLSQAVRIADEIAGELFQSTWDDPMRVTIVVLRLAVWVLGTIATLIFIFRGQRGEDDA